MYISFLKLTKYIIKLFSFKLRTFSTPNYIHPNVKILYCSIENVFKMTIANKKGKDPDVLQ